MVVGTGTDLSSIDFKFNSTSVSSWNMHRGNINRTGFYISTSDMQPGDVNQDMTLDILDIVMLVNFAVGNTNPTDLEFFLSDINSDLTIDILGKMHKVSIIEDSPYDPENKLLRT